MDISSIEASSKNTHNSCLWASLNIHSNLQCEHLWTGRKSNQVQKIDRNKVDNQKISRLKPLHFHLNEKINNWKEKRWYFGIRIHIGWSYLDNLPFKTIILFTHKSLWTTVVYGESSERFVFRLNSSHVRNWVSIISRNCGSKLFTYCNSEQTLYLQFQQMKLFKNELKQIN